MELRTLLWQLRGAAHDVLTSGSDDQHAKAREVLVEARRSLYRILAGDEPTKD